MLSCEIVLARADQLPKHSGGWPKREKFDQVERKIADCHQHIVSQHKIIDRLKANGSDCIAAEWALANLVDILDTCRAKLQIVVERRSSMGFHCIEE